MGRMGMARGESFQTIQLLPATRTTKRPNECLDFSDYSIVLKGVKRELELSKNVDLMQRVRIDSTLYSRLNLSD